MDNDTNKRIQNLERQVQEFIEWKRNKDIQQISYPLDEVSRTIINRDNSASSFTVLGDNSTITISSGVITVTSSYHEVDTEGAASTDDVDTITVTDIANGTLLVLQPASPARTVVIKDGTGNLRTAGDFTMDNSQDTITLIKDGSVWYEVSRSDNGA